MNLDKQPNDSVSVTIQMKLEKGYGTPMSWSPLWLMAITIRNSSERTIYVDKQKSYVIPNEEMIPLYSGSTTVSAKSNTTMNGVNLGLVGVGSASSDYNSTIKQEQRFLAIPGGTKTVLHVIVAKQCGIPWTLNNNCGNIQLSTYVIKGYPGDHNIISQNCIYSRDILTYTDDNNPLNVDFRICYSFNENMEPNMVNKAMYYTKYVIGTDTKYHNYKDYRYDNSYDSAKKLFPSLDACMSDPNMLVMMIPE